jgi:hypothetical protein
MVEKGPRFPAIVSEAVRLQDFAAGTCRRVSPQDFGEIPVKDCEIHHEKWWFNGI